MSARLQRFYGGDPAGWLMRVPYGIVRAYLRMMKRLLAEESQRASERVFIGTHRSAEGDDFKEIQRSWQEDAQRAKRDRLSPEMMSGMGIRYTVVELADG